MGWLYRRGGFDALYPRVRRDDGQARAIPQAIADQLLHWKEEKLPRSMFCMAPTLANS